MTVQPHRQSRSWTSEIEATAGQSKLSFDHKLFRKHLIMHELMVDRGAFGREEKMLAPQYSSGTGQCSQKKQKSSFIS